MPGQHIGPLFSAKLVRWSEHPVLSKSPVIRGTISTDGVDVLTWLMRDKSTDE
jgi:hypothetical protein